MRTWPTYRSIDAAGSINRHNGAASQGSAARRRSPPWIDVDIGDPGHRYERPCDLVDRWGAGEPGAQVDEPADTLPGGPADRVRHERPVLTDQLPQRWVDSQQALSFGAVGGVVVLTAQILIIYWAGNHTCGPERGYVMLA